MPSSQPPSFPPKERFIARLAELAPPGTKSAIEFGCGSGQDALCLRRRTGWRVLATDFSAEALSRIPPEVETKQIDVGGSKEQVLGSFDLAYCAFLVHLLEHREKELLFRLCFRCLRPGGVLACLTASEADLRRRLIASYFPSALKIDLCRYLSLRDNETLMEEAGFASVRHEELELDPALPVNLDFYAQKQASILRLLPPEEYDAGLKRLRDDFGHARGAGQETRAWRRTLLISRKP